jgi:hypothetical protein
MSSTREAKSAVSIFESINTSVTPPIFKDADRAFWESLIINKRLSVFLAEINEIKSIEQVLIQNTFRQNALQYVLSGELFGFSVYKRVTKNKNADINVGFLAPSRPGYQLYSSEALQRAHLPMVITSLLKPFKGKENAEALKKLLTDKDSNGFTSLHYLYGEKTKFSDNIYKEFEQLITSLSPASQTEIVTTTTPKGNTVLHNMVKARGFSDLVKHMNCFDRTAMQAAVKMSNIRHNTPVHLLAEFKFSESDSIMPYLAQLLTLDEPSSGCNMNKIMSLPNVDKRNVLHLLFENKNIAPADKEASCELLIKQLKKQQLESQDSKNKNHYKETMLGLDKDGYTPIHHACVADSYKLATKRFAETMRDRGQAGLLSARHADVAVNYQLVAQLLLDENLSEAEKIDIAVRPTASGMTLLQLAAEYSTKETLDAVLSVTPINEIIKTTTQKQIVELKQSDSFISSSDFESTVSRHTVLPAIYQYLKDYRSKDTPDYLRRRDDFIACVYALKNGSKVPLEDQRFRAKEHLSGLFKGSEQYRLIRNDLQCIENKPYIINKFLVYLTSQATSCPVAADLADKLGQKKPAASVPEPEATAGSSGPRREEGIELRPFPEPEATAGPSPLADPCREEEGIELRSYRPQ